MSSLQEQARLDKFISSFGNSTKKKLIDICFKKATGKLQRTLWSLSQATTLFIREKIHASIMEVFNYFVLELQHFKGFKVYGPL